tara:strand:+ start:511 stop:900 length:390 start_codon:yes stop_codon:yes gene_type:complete
MSEKFNLEIVSPEKVIIKQQVTSVTIPSFEGEMTLLINHIPLITFLRPGIVKVTGEKTSEYFIEEGTVEFSKNNLILLSSTILDLKTLSKDKLNKMISECKDLLKKENIDDKTNYINSHKADVLSRINL